MAKILGMAAAALALAWAWIGQGAPGAGALGSAIAALGKPGPGAPAAPAARGGQQEASAPAQAVWWECEAPGKRKAYAGRQEDCPGGKGKRVSRIASSLNLAPGPELRGSGPKQGQEPGPEGQAGEAAKLLEKLNSLGAGEAKSMP